MNQSKCKHTLKGLIGLSMFFGLLLTINFIFFSLPTIFFFGECYWASFLGLFLVSF
jgi:hypothetical protein